MIKLTTRTARGAAAMTLAVAAALGGTAMSGAAPTETCYVATDVVPYYSQAPNRGGEIRGWVNAGTRFEAAVRDGYWRGGSIPRVASGVFIHSNYLNCP
ncbi:hypothetical protein [Streptomonospora wellingtoniae]|uniref:Uncharacterized protein n=1 Tax=Streptomonospora wellingtoniae TaxID=3075544 RepID=A0ABU2KRG0_9ACTN|nr:hypothetical protein [Streptomonospora sp. DSM 45055]MDT0301876.1 hypothetical protein [Streptomonospora sp. DSM 45055]